MLLPAEEVIVKMQFLKIDEDELIIESAFRADMVFLDRNEQKLGQF
jgi:hypothetical protein